MNQSSALKMLGATPEMDKEEIEDVIEEKVFEIKSKILKPPYLPRIIQIQIDRLEKILTASSVILNVKTTASDLSNFSFKGELAPAYKSYQSQLQQALLQVSQAREVEKLIQSAKNLKSMQLAWYQYVYQWRQQYLSKSTNFDPTLSKVIDPVALYKAIAFIDTELENRIPPSALQREVLFPLWEEMERITKYTNLYE